jgi:hypothetical protein
MMRFAMIPLARWSARVFSRQNVGGEQKAHPGLGACQSEKQELELARRFATAAPSPNEGVTKATQAITTEIADYSKRSFEQGTETMENLLASKSLDQAFKVQRYARAVYESYVSEVTKARRTLFRSGKRSLQAIPELCRKTDPDRRV